MPTGLVFGRRKEIVDGSLVDISYEFELAPFTAEVVDELLALTEQVFGSADRLDGTWRITHMPDVSLFAARHVDYLVGFKLGYAVTSRRYYSWLGGVHPQFRGRGIARALMKQQHEWIAQRGYAVVETEVRRGNQAMSALNTSCGYVPAGNKCIGEHDVVILRKVFEDA